MISNDLRWRAVVLTFIYGIPLGLISDILGVSPSSIKRWTVLFKKTGHVGNEKERAMHSRYPPEVGTKPTALAALSYIISMAIGKFVVGPFVKT